MEPDYQAMYYKMMDATEKAIEILINAQLECEKIYIESEETKIPAVEE